MEQAGQCLQQAGGVEHQLDCQVLLAMRIVCAAHASTVNTC